MASRREERREPMQVRDARDLDDEPPPGHRPDSGPIPLPDRARVPPAQRRNRVADPEPAGPPRAAGQVCAVESDMVACCAGAFPGQDAIGPEDHAEPEPPPTGGCKTRETADRPAYGRHHERPDPPG